MLNSLNPAQLQAATVKLGNLLILAGAGSGKTRVLIHRIEWLITAQGAAPYHILAVTFTNKAAAEMRARLAAQLQGDLSSMWIGTFHGIAHKLLRMHWANCGLPENFQILDGEDQLRVIRRIFKKLNINEDHWEPRQAQNYINRKKDDGKRTKHLMRGNNPFEQVMLEIYREYEQICQREGLLDFAELLLLAYELLMQNVTLLAHYRQKFLHIFVDEFQDTNKIQYDWLKLFANSAHSTTVVGDDDQSIYGWRGACIENIYRFDRDFPPTTIMRLEQNYRSTGTILAAANAVISCNSGRYGKTLWTQAEQGEPITLYVALNEEDEALYLVKQILKYREAGYALEDMAILYRSNAQSRVLEDALLRVGLEYSIYGGLRFFERAEIKDALAYLRLLVNQHDNTAFDRAINNPPRGIGARSLEKIRELAALHNISYWQASQQALSEQIISGRVVSGINSFIGLITELSQVAAAIKLSAIIEQIIAKSGLLQFFSSQPGETARSRIENLKELVNATATYTTEPEYSTNYAIITDFLNFASLDAGSRDEGKGGVQLMTLHAAKGLEFPLIFMCGVEEGLFPHHFSKDDPQALAEERRLCYVGITRAKQKLFLTFAEVRRLFGREEARRVSRFISEIPSHLIDEERRKFSIRHNGSVTARSDGSRSYGFRGHNQSSLHGSMNSGMSTAAIATTMTAAASIAHKVSRVNFNRSDDPALLIGRRVKHQKFGSGIVIDQEGSAEKTRVHINFDVTGAKWLMLSYANLEI